MLENLESVDWKRYKRGFYPADIPALIRSFASDDSRTRLACYDKLNSIVDSAYNELDDFPVIIVPFLVELLTYPNVQDKDAITDLLIYMTSFVDAIGETYKKYGQNLRLIICQNVNETKSRFVELTGNVDEDIQYLATICVDV